MNNRKITIGRFIITLLMLIITVIGGTYAWLNYTSKKSTLVLTIGDINDSKVIIKPYEISETMVPVNTYTSGVYSQVKVINNNDNKMLLSMFYVINQLDDVLINNGLKYTIVYSVTEDGDYTLVKTGDFTTIKDNKQVIFDVKIPSNTTIYSRVYLWLDSSVGDQSLVQNSSLNLELNASIQCDANAPVLDSGMIPVVISNDGIVTTISRDNDDWYNYSKQEWANMVLVTSSSRSNYLDTEGVEVSQSDILGYYVWIPRYRYKIWEAGVSSTGNEQSIDIMFESQSTPITLDRKVGGYVTHPAFWWDVNSDGLFTDNEILPGIWVGKFEMTGTGDNPTVLPNMTSLTNQDIYTQLATSLKFAGGTLNMSDWTVSFMGNDDYGLTIDTDSHMIKNSEWGAVAYLSHSIYGINREVRINNYNNSGTLTGCGAATENEAESTTCGIVYGQANEYPQSTTGNITGIYDMSGGAREYVMGHYNVSEFENWKYCNLYSSVQFNSDYNTNVTLCTLDTCGGHALSETNNWYSDYAYFVDSEYNLFLRGGTTNGGYGDSVGAGIFNFDVDSGNAYSNESFRSVLIPVETYNVTYEANMFSTTNQTTSDATISYDGTTSYLTIDGTPYSGINLMKFSDITFTEGEQYEISLTYVSGSFTENNANAFVTEVNSDVGDGALSTRNHVDMGFPSSGTYKATLTINSAAASEGNFLHVWIWLYTADAIIFDNYVVKVVITKVESDNINYGDYYRFPENPTRMGYTFNGWYTSESGGTQVTSETLMSTLNNHTLYAHWKLSSYTVTYDANGGTGAPSSQTKNWGQTLTLSSTVPTRSGYTFLGWSTSSTATSATYEAGGSYTTNASTTLYAVWQVSKRVPTFTYTGNYQIVDENNNVISDTSSWINDWKIRFLTSGTLTISELNGASSGIDIFVVAGGGNGAKGGIYGSPGGGGGGGGASITVTKFPVETNVSYDIVVGSAKSNSSFGKSGTAYYTALAGSTPDRTYLENGIGWICYQGAGGAGRLSGQTSNYGAANVTVNVGGTGDGRYSAGDLKDGTDGIYEFNGTSGLRYGAGGGAGGKGVSTGYSGSGSSGSSGNNDGGGTGGQGCSYVYDQSIGSNKLVGAYSGSAATANTGSGGGGGGSMCGSGTNSSGNEGTGGAGGSGIVIIRNTR